MWAELVHIKSFASHEAFSGHLSSEAPPFGNSHAILAPQHGGGCHFGDKMQAAPSCQRRGSFQNNIVLDLIVTQTQ